MSEVKQYAERDLMAMDIAGNHYCRHVDHMTSEKLHSKSDIAAELGWRDMQIASLKAERDALAAENLAMKGLVEERCWVYDYDVEGYRDAHDYLPATPATDAYANQLRAEGAASVGTLIRACVHEFPDSAEDIVEECAMIADNRAINLCKGNDHD